MKRRPTVYDVAELAGVSTATVSFVFSKPERVRETTRQIVLDAASRLGYVPSGAARGLALGRTGAIGLYSYDYIVDGGDDTDADDGARRFPLYADEVRRGVEVECRRREYALLLGGNKVSDHIPLGMDFASRVDGLIAFAGVMPPEVLTLVAARIPVVELGGEVRAPGVRTVSSDGYRGMAELVTHLIAEHGFRRFSYVGELVTAEFRARHLAFADSLRAASLPIPPLLSGRAADDRYAHASVASAVASGDLPDVFVCDTDQTALATMDALADAGVRVPDDVAVTGFDGIVAGRLRTPTLTTVRQPMSAIGRTAVALLVDRVEDDRVESGSRVLDPVLAVGGSCGCGR